MRKRTMARGLTIIEVLMGLSIAAMLLVAVGTAMIAVTQNVRTNDSYIRARNGAEGALKYMVTSVRRAKQFSLSSDGKELTVLDSGDYDDASGWNGKNSRWSIFRVESGQLMLERRETDENGAPKGDAKIVPLSRHVRNTSFRTVTDDGANRSVIIDMTVDCGDAFNANKTTSFPLSGTAMARSFSRDF